MPQDSQACQAWQAFRLAPGLYPVQALNQAMREQLLPLGQLLGLAVL